MVLAVEYTDCIPVEKYDSFSDCPVYDAKPSDGGTAFLELCGMWSTSSLPLLPSPHWLRVVVSVRISSIGQIVLTLNWIIKIT